MADAFFGSGPSTTALDIAAARRAVRKYESWKQPAAKHRNAACAGLTEHLDDSIGIVLQAIKDAGVYDSTIVIFFSDNGGEVRRGVTSNAPPAAA